MNYLCIKAKIPSFYHDFLCSWSKLRYVGLFEVKNIENEIIWKNSNITFNKRLLIFEKWKYAGIVRVKDVIRNREWITPNILNKSLYPSQLLFDVDYAKLKKSFPVYWLNKLIKKNYKLNLKKE